MQPRTLQQIISELNPTFQAQTESLQQQQSLIPQQIQTEENALGAKQTEAFGSILDGARRRGLGFAGIPLGEQAKYNATDYLPAIARLRQQGQQQAMSLQDAILGINERRDTLGQQIYQTEQDRAFQAQQAEANRRAQAAAAAATLGSFGNLGGSQTPQQTQSSTLPKVQKTPASISKSGQVGFNFTDAYGKPINAAQYVQLYNAQGGKLSYRSLLQQMANEGDNNARIALNYVGDDAKFGNAPSQFQGALTALGATGSFQQAQSAPRPQTTISAIPMLQIPGARR